MEVTEIILAKISRLCELSSQSRGFLTGPSLWNFVAHKTPSQRVLSFFSSRQNWDSPNPSPAGECGPPPFNSGGRGTLAGERGVGEFQFQRGDIQCGTLYMYVLCATNISRDGSHRDNFGENLKTLWAVESESQVSFKAIDLKIFRAYPINFCGTQDTTTKMLLWRSSSMK